MFDKSTTFKETKNRVFTPEEIETACTNLPHNYLVETMRKLQEMVAEGTATKVYSKRYILSVKQRKAYNKDILTALVMVGMEEYNNRKMFKTIAKNQ